MDATIRNVDEDTYRQAKALAAMQGKPLGEVVNEALRALLDRSPPMKRGTLRAVKVRDLGPGTERLSDEIDRTTYGA